MTSSGRTSLPSRLTAIDETTRADHYYLAEEDRCFCFGEYFADQGWGHSPTNQLIFNYYDDRIVKTLRRAFAGYNVDIRELLRQSVNANADHGSSNRITPESLLELLIIDHDAWDRALPRPINDFENLDEI